MKTSKKRRRAGRLREFMEGGPGDQCQHSDPSVVPREPDLGRVTRKCIWFGWVVYAGVMMFFGAVVGGSVGAFWWSLGLSVPASLLIVCSVMVFGWQWQSDHMQWDCATRSRSLTYPVSGVYRIGDVSDPDSEPVEIDWSGKDG